MELIVVSDSHGKNEYLDKILELYPNADYYLHCGDIGFNKEIYLKFFTVQGNNDKDLDYPLEILLETQKHKLLLLHGHQLPSKNRSQKLVEYAKNVGADIVCYGHTHLARVEELDNILLVNPGALWRCLGGKGPSYAIINIDGRKKTAQIKYFK